jgi:hypothetical protein
MLGARGAVISAFFVADIDLKPFFTKLQQGIADLSLSCVRILIKKEPLFYLR